MFKNKKYLFILIFLAFVACKENERVPNVNEGVLDLSDVRSDELDIISLQGTWSFYWNQIPTDSIGNYNESLLTNETFIPIDNGSWQVNGHPAKGYGTFRLRIHLPKESLNLKLKILRVESSAQVWVNGLKNQDFGVFSTHEETSIAFGRSLLINIPNEEIVDVVIMVSNYQHSKGGGFPFESFLGDANTIDQKSKVSAFIQNFTFGIIFLISLYHLIVFFDNRKIILFYFAVCSIFFSSRQLFIGEVTIYDFFPNISFETVQLWRYISFHVGVVFFTLYFRKILPLDTVKKVDVFFVISYSLFFFYVLVTPVYESTYIGSFHFPLIWVFFVYVFYSMYKGFRNKRKYSKIIFFNSLLAIILFANDILYLQKVINSVFLSNLGILLFFLLQTIINYRYNKEININREKLYSTVKELNESVEENKKEITNLLSESIQELQERQKYTHKLDQVRKKVNDADLNEVLAELKSKKLEESRKLILKENMKELSIGFRLKIEKEYPSLTKNEIETCMMIHLKFSSNEICNLKAISPLTLKSSRYRIRKKMNLPKEITLKDYLIGLEI